MKDLYSILHISKEASKDDIKKAYRKLAFEYHPDKNNKSTSDKFNDISEAYEILSDDNKRYNYDCGGDIILNQQNPFDIFSHIFNDNDIFNHGGFHININDLSNVNIQMGTSINTSTQIIGNKKIVRIEKTETTANGTITTLEEKIEII